MPSSGRAGAPSRSQAAFNWLLSGDDDGDERSRRKGDSRPAGDKRKGKGERRHSGGGGGTGTGRTYIPGFKLRDEGEARAAEQSSDALESLREAFAGLFPPELIADVLASCGGDPTAASEALLALAGDGPAPLTAVEPSRAHAPAEEQLPAAEAVAAAAGGAGAAPPPPCCHWDRLPGEVKRLVLDQLSLRDLARAARACRELAAHVRQQGRSLRTVVVPEGVSLAAVRSLVAAFGGAGGVALWRCAPRLRFQHEFEDMLRAVAAGEADRASGVAVSQLSLARCGGATDGVVSAACDALAHLTRLDLSRCTEVGDAAVHRLAAYTRRPGADDSDASSGEEGGDADTVGEEAAAALAGLQLSGSPVQAAAPATPAGLESPESAVRRIAAQRHAAMVEGAAAAQRAQHGRPAARGLRELCLKETGVSRRGVRALLQPGSATSRSLRALDVSRCAALGADLDLNPRACLEVLRASGCCSLRTAVIQLPPEAPLRELALDGCRQLLEVTLVAPRLLDLNLSHCGQLRSLSLRCRRLRRLRAVNCSSLSLSAGELHCPALEEVSFFGCRQLDAEGLEAAAASLAGCRVLDLTGCISLSRLLLPEAAALHTVSVSGCGLLRQVLLASPHLRQFRAAGCTRLMELRMGPASLACLDLENCSNLREVQLSQGGGAGPAAGEAAEAGGAADEQAAAKPRKPALVLRGCSSLPDDAKQRIRAAMLARHDQTLRVWQL